MKKQMIKSKSLFCIFSMFLLLAHLNNAIGQDYGELVLTFEEVNEEANEEANEVDFEEANKEVFNKAARMRMTKHVVLSRKATLRSDNYLKDYGRSLNDFDPKLLRMDHNLIKLLAKYTLNVLRIGDPEVDASVKEEIRLTNSRIKAGLEKDYSYSFERALDFEELDILFKLFPNPSSDNSWSRLKTIDRLTGEEKIILKSALYGMNDLKRTVDRREAPREEVRD